MAIWNSNCEVESVNGTLEQIIRNFVENSEFSRLCPISLNTFQTILQLMEGYIMTIWNSLESVWGFRKSSAECSVFSRLFHFRWSATLMLIKLYQNNAQNIWSSFQEFGIGFTHFEQAPPIPSKFPCFPDCVPSAEFHFQRVSIGSFEPYGTV